MSFNSLPGIQSLAQEAANLLGLNNWDLQNATYNGVQFHWMQPAYNQVNPAASIINYVESALEGGSQKPSFDTWSFVKTHQDSIKRKLGIQVGPDFDGAYVADYGLSETYITMTGICFGSQHFTVKDMLTSRFCDSQALTASGEPVFENGLAVGKLSGTSFRTLVTPVNSPAPGTVFLKSLDILTQDSLYNGCVFKVEFVCSNPGYLSQPAPPANSLWNEIQQILNSAQGAAADINQAISFGQFAQNPSDSALSTGNTNSSVIVPVLNWNGKYLSTIRQDIQNRLLNLSLIFNSSVAFYVQNSENQVNDTYWQAYQIDYALLPIAIGQNYILTNADAQVVLSNYNEKITEFIVYIDENYNSVGMQNNVFALNKSLSLLSNLGNYIINKLEQTQEILVEDFIDVFDLLYRNGVNPRKYNDVYLKNAGKFYSGMILPPGVVITV